MPLLNELLPEPPPLWLIFTLLLASIAILALSLAQAIRALRRPGLPGLLYAAQLLLGFWAIALGALLPWSAPVVALASIWIAWKLRSLDPDATTLPTLTSLATLAICAAILLAPRAA